MTSYGCFIDVHVFLTFSFHVFSEKMINLVASEENASYIRYRCCKMPRTIGQIFADDKLENVKVWEGYYCPESLDLTGRPRYTLDRYFGPDQLFVQADDNETDETLTTTTTTAIVLLIQNNHTTTTTTTSNTTTTTSNTTTTNTTTTMMDITTTTTTTPESPQARPDTSSHRLD